MTNPTPNVPEYETTSPYESFDSKKLHEAAERALDHHLGTHPDKKSKRRNGDLFSVCPDINTETLLANASEDLLSISAIAADLADGVEGSRRSVALALSRMAELSERWIIWMNRKWRRFSPSNKAESADL